MSRGKYLAPALLCICLFILAQATAIRSQTSTIPIGVGAPLTGPLAALGSEVAKGATLAVDRINARGGIQGRKLELLVRDDRCQSDVAANIAREMIEKDKAAAILGFPCQGGAIAARDIANRANILMVSLASSQALTSPDFRNVLRLMGPEDALARMSVDFLTANFAGKKIAAALSTTASSFNTSLRLAASARGLSFAHVVEINPGGPAAELPKDSDVLFLSPGWPEARVRQLVDQTQGPVVVSKTVFNEADRELFVRENISVITNPGPSFFAEAPNSPGGMNARELPQGGYFIYAFSAVETFVSLARQARELTGNSLGDLARRQEIPTALGRLRFTEKGDPVGWKFAVWSKSGLSVAAIDVCKKDNCKDYDQCPRDCPK